MQGGVAQGIGQALLRARGATTRERPGADRLVHGLRHAARRRPARRSTLDDAGRCRRRANPLGVKGAGEAGAVGATPAVMNAIMDALAPLGVARRSDAGDAGARVARDPRRRSKSAANPRA